MIPGVRGDRSIPRETLSIILELSRGPRAWNALPQKVTSCPLNFLFSAVTRRPISSGVDTPDVQHVATLVFSDVFYTYDVKFDCCILKSMSASSGRESVP